MGTDRQIEQVSKWLVRLWKAMPVVGTVMFLFTLPGTIQAGRDYAEVWQAMMDAVVGLLPSQSWYPIGTVLGLLMMAVGVYPIGRDVVKAYAVIYNETFAEDPLRQAIMRLAVSVVFMAFPVIVLCVCLVVLMATSWVVHYIGRALLQLVA